MKVSDGPEVYGYTIFCDEIRMEMNQKLIYIGTYASGTMVVHTKFPTILSRLTMDIVYLQRKRSFIAPSQFIVAMPGELEENASFRFDVPSDQIAEALEKEKAKMLADPDIALIRMGGPLTLTNIQISQPGRIMVRAVRNDEYIRLGALNIIQGAVPEEATLPQKVPSDSA
jgi:hypothetical protein